MGKTESAILGRPGEDQLGTWSEGYFQKSFNR
jgi:hypothetical protein